MLINRESDDLEAFSPSEHQGQQEVWCLFLSKYLSFLYLEACKIFHLFLEIQELYQEGPNCESFF